ncbi:MAG: hypothetical protein KGK08_08445 [Acidobacteriota bacterium]|nr:hypothetical protein [Acidobacteriota bacterium]
MTKSMKALMLGAAVTGLLGGSTVQLHAATTQTSVNALGQTAYAVATDSKDKHACKGQNSCKGKGGCKSSDNGCKAKNSCKGKGGCATDGSKMPSL